MLTKGGYTAAAGTYWNLMSGERIELAQAGALPGSAGVRYLKAPGAVMVMAGPLLGLLFAVFLPFIGIAMTVRLVIGKVIDVLTSAASGSLSFGWRPAESYFAGRKRRKAAEARGVAAEERSK